MPCDLYVAAFLAPKITLATTAGPDGLPRRGAETVPTAGTLWELLRGRESHGLLVQNATGALEGARAFHWPLEFPDIMSRGGFDVVLGNPPWERIKLQEQEFFAARAPEIAGAPNKAARSRLIKALSTAKSHTSERKLFDAFEAEKRLAEAISALVRLDRGKGGRFWLTGTGDANTYSLFAEMASHLIGKYGFSGLVVPAGLMTDVKTKNLFFSLFLDKKIDSFYCFDNTLGIFPSIHRDTPFGLLTILSDEGKLEFCVEAQTISEMRDPRRRFVLNCSDLELLNCNTRTAPTFRSNADADLAKKIYGSVPTFVRETEDLHGNPWNIRLYRMFDSAQDSHLFIEKDQISTSEFKRRGMYWINRGGERSGAVAYFPLYEGKMIRQYDHRAGTFQALAERPPRGASLPEPDIIEKTQVSYEVEPWYWVDARDVHKKLNSIFWYKSWSFGYRFGSNPTNARTVIASVVPISATPHVFPQVIAGREIPSNLCVALLANMNALVVDYVSRIKMSRQGLDAFIVKQLPVLPPKFYSEGSLDFLVRRVLELTYTSNALSSFARDVGHDGPPFAWDEERRAHLRAELDAFYARAYGLSRDELRYILDPADVMGPDYPSETFRVLKEKEIPRPRRIPHPPPRPRRLGPDGGERRIPRARPVTRWR